MNKKVWWQKIKSNYPLTLADCKGFFEMRFREDYRTKMQDYTELLPYFQEKYIRIDLRPSYRAMGSLKFGYKIYAASLTIQRDPIFEHQEAAAFDALELTFRIREEYIRRRGQVAKFKPKSQWHKADRKKKTEGQTLGERVKGK